VTNARLRGVALAALLTLAGRMSSIAESSPVETLLVSNTPAFSERHESVAKDQINARPGRSAHRAVSRLQACPRRGES